MKENYTKKDVIEMFEKIGVEVDEEKMFVNVDEKEKL